MGQRKNCQSVAEPHPPGAGTRPSSHSNQSHSYRPLKQAPSCQSHTSHGHQAHAHQRLRLCLSLSSQPCPLGKASPLRALSHNHAPSPHSHTTTPPLLTLTQPRPLRSLLPQTLPGGAATPPALTLTDRRRGRLLHEPVLDAPLRPSLTPPTCRKSRSHFWKRDGNTRSLPRASDARAWRTAGSSGSRRRARMGGRSGMVGVARAG